MTDNFDDWGGGEVSKTKQSKPKMNITNVEEIVEETQRESIINRPHNLAGSIKRVFKERYAITEDKAEYRESSIVPALLKIFMEGCDNPIDIAIKGGCDQISINVDSKSISIQDNGYGISSEKDENGEYIVYKALCKYNTSSNYTDMKGQGQKGVNGIGIKLACTLSTKFEAESDDGVKLIKLKAVENNLKHTVTSHRTTKKTGLKIRFEPDFKIFEVDEIDEEHIQRMYEYILIQSLTYPNIKFKFNDKPVNFTNKKFIKLFGEDFVLEQTDDYFFAFFPNESDEFRQISYVNGLETSKGGSHINFLTNEVVTKVRDKLLKKFKTLKPADVKQKMLCVVIAKNMKHIDWDGQTKESITSPVSIMREYFSDTNFDKLALEIFKNKAFIEPITEVYRIKAEFKRRQDMKGLTKVVKKIKSEKYLPAIGKKHRLFIAEGDSAVGGLSPVLGRTGNGFYALKGLPLNAYQATHEKFLKNVELSELYKIIKAEGYTEIIIATDADLDGIHIRGILMGFFDKYLPAYKGKIGILSTPVKFIKKGKVPVRWTYDLNEEMTPKTGEIFKYVKGLGTWNAPDLKYIIQKEGLSKMISMIVFDDDEIIGHWLDKSVDKRKEYILANEFSISKL